MMKKCNLVLLFAFAFLIIVGCTSEQENNWPNFRGPNSLGIAPESAIPPLELNPDKNLFWRTSLASGVSSPCVYKNMIFITGYDKEMNTLITYCVDFAKGSVIWKNSVIPDSLEQVHSVGSPASTTPVTDGSSVYVYFGSYGALCYDFSGNLLWETRLPILNAQNGTCGSPIIHDSLLIINRVDMVKPSVLAINKINGKTSWETFLDITPVVQKDYFVSHATPIIWRDQIIIHRSFGLNSIFLKDGSPSWTFEIVSMGVSTPVIVDDTLYLNGFFTRGESTLFDELPEFEIMIRQHDNNGDKVVNISEIPSEWAFWRRPELNLPLGIDVLCPIKDVAPMFDTSKDNALGLEEWGKLKEFLSNLKFEHGTIAVNLNYINGANKPSLIWKQNEFVSEVPSPLVIGDKVYMIMDGGTLSCYKTNTGDLVFRERINAPGPYIASPLYANGYIYLVAYNGKVTVVKPGDKLNIVSKSDLRERVAASPVALSNLMLVRTENALYAFNN